MFKMRKVKQFVREGLESVSIQGANVGRRQERSLELIIIDDKKGLHDDIDTAIQKAIYILLLDAAFGKDGEHARSQIALTKAAMNLAEKNDELIFFHAVVELTKYRKI